MPVPLPHILAVLLLVTPLYAQEMMDPKVLPATLFPEESVDLETLIDRVAAGNTDVIGLPAENTNTLNLADVINMAAANNKVIQQSKKDMDSARALYTGSIQDFYVPSLSVGASLSLGDQYNPASFGSFNNITSGTDPVFNIQAPSVKLSWRVFNGFGTLNAYRAAKDTYITAALTYTNAVRSNIYSSVTRYYEQFYREENVRVILDNISILRQQMRESQARYAAGRISDVDLNTSRANYYNSLPNYYNAERLRLFARDDFHRFIGYKPQSNENIVLQGSLYEVTNVMFAAFDEEESLNYIYTNDSMLASLRSTVSNAIYTKGQVNAQRMPTLDLSASFTPNYGSDVTVPTFGNAEYRSSLTGMATLTIPILEWIPGTGLASQVKSAEMKRQRAELQLEDALEQKINDVKNTLMNIKEISLNVDALRISENTARLAANAARIQYQNGRISLLELNQSLQTLLLTRQNLLTMIYNDLSVRLGLQQSIQPLPGFINEVNRIQPVDLQTQ